MKIIAIDPGYDRVGIAIIEKNDTQREVVVFSTCIETEKNQSFYNRMSFVQQSLEKIISTYNPDHMVVEQLYFAKNTKTALLVAEAKGIIAGIFLVKNIPITEIHPNHVKIAITGNGAATKSDLLWMLPKLVSINPAGKLDDELDAIAIGLGFLAHYRYTLLQK
jgi:crossover junction endodeoxyribonuclease RuvC